MKSRSVTKLLSLRSYPLLRHRIINHAQAEEWPLLRYVLDDSVYRAEYLKELRWMISEHGPVDLAKVRGNSD